MMSGTSDGGKDRPWLWAALLCGAVLRLASLPDLAIEHYDEGVYASNLLFLESEGGEFPGRALFAPPLWPVVLEGWTIAANMIVNAAPRWLPMLPGIFCGIALIPTAAWVMRRWFGPPAGIAAAWLIALSEYHAFYSRTALTDAPLLLGWLWAVALIGFAMEHGDVRSAVIAGIVTAVGWWTKYNGWLPLAIGLSGGMAYQVLLPANQRSWSRLWRTLAIVLGTAVLLWLPVLGDCQKVGGYTAVAANHRGYMEPWSKWLATFGQQGANLDHYAGWLSAVGGLVAFIVVWQTGGGQLSVPLRRSVFGVIALLAGLALWTSLAGLTFGVILTGSLAAMGYGLIRWRRGELSSQEILAACLLSAWLLGMLLATPRYHAYPRLAMPLWLAGCLGTAWFLAQIVRRRQPPNASTPPRRLHPFVVPGVVIAAVFGLMFAGGTKAWEPRTALAQAADEIRQRLSTEHASGSPPVVFVYGEPALFVHLRERGVAAVLGRDLSFVEAPPPTAVYQVTGLFSQRDATWQQEWERYGDRFESVNSWTIHPSSLILLDNLSPAELRARPHDAKRNLTLYRLQPR